MQRWNWFLAADASGRWVTTKGYAEVEITGRNLAAKLMLGEDSPPYHLMSAKLEKGDIVRATVSSPDDGIEPFELMGELYRGPKTEPVRRLTILLSDGSTVIGMTYGPRSDAVE